MKSRRQLTRDGAGGNRGITIEPGVVTTTPHINLVPPPQKDIQKSVLKDDRRIRSLIKNISDVIALVDKRARVRYCSPSVTSVLGYSEEAFIGLSVHTLVHPDDLEAARKIFADLLSNPGSTTMTEHRIRHADGSWRWMEGVATNLLHDPDVHAVVLNYRDTTDRKNAEMERLRLAAIVQSTEDAIIGKTLDGTIISWNKGAEHLYGYPAEEVIGRSISILIPDDRQQEVVEILKSIKNGENVEPYESIRRTKKGKKIVISVRVSPVYLPSGELIGASAIARDITAHKRAEKERELLVTELRHALAELMTLRGMLPICAWCKKVRDDEGYWNQIDSYLESHSQMQFTHGICPECIAKYHQHTSIRARGK